MSDEKYGKEELELVYGVIDAYRKLADTFILLEKGNPNSYAIMTENTTKLGTNVHLGVKKDTVDYSKFALDKILKDNFDEDFVKEKLKEQ